MDRYSWLVLLGTEKGGPVKKKKQYPFHNRIITNCSVWASVLSVYSRLKKNVIREGLIDSDCLDVLENVSCVEVVVESYVLLKR